MINLKTIHLINFLHCKSRHICRVIYTTSFLRILCIHQNTNVVLLLCLFCIAKIYGDRVLLALYLHKGCSVVKGPQLEKRIVLLNSKNGGIYVCVVICPWEVRFVTKRRRVIVILSLRDMNYCKFFSVLNF